jgi:hypothetical protein
MPRSPSRRGEEYSFRPGEDLLGDLFGTGSVEDLQKAIILREVLGPPLALREDWD